MFLILTDTDVLQTFFADSSQATHEKGVKTMEASSAVAICKEVDPEYNGPCYFPQVESSFPYRPCRRSYTDKEINKQ